MFNILQKLNWLLNYSKRGILLPLLLKLTDRFKVEQINLGSGSQKIPGYWGLDLTASADLMIDLSRGKLPFKSGALESVVCTSALNYFTHKRAREIIRETYRVLKPGGIARFSVQDLRSLAERYLAKDNEFFFQKLPNGQDRFEGSTLGDKFVSWFYGYKTLGGPCRYMYDYESLSYLFKEAGFSTIEKKDYRDSRLENIELIDNRPDQMFFLEAVK